MSWATFTCSPATCSLVHLHLVHLQVAGLPVSLVHLLCPQDIWAEREGLWSHTLWITETLYRGKWDPKDEEKKALVHHLTLLYIYSNNQSAFKNILICSPKINSF